eukprot:GHRR01033043.1.p1 GENE.GHRR01033043.1~~GHRR01033043.1.p1  ORF type:complete len:211 (+),score=29.70 GHRR01033043.1:89-721(+)
MSNYVPRQWRQARAFSYVPSAHLDGQCSFDASQSLLSCMRYSDVTPSLAAKRGSSSSSSSRMWCSRTSMMSCSFPSKFGSQIRVLFSSARPSLSCWCSCSRWSDTMSPITSRIAGYTTSSSLAAWIEISLIRFQASTCFCSALVPGSLYCLYRSRALSWSSAMVVMTFLVPVQSDTARTAQKMVGYPGHSILTSSHDTLAAKHPSLLLVG